MARIMVCDDDKKMAEDLIVHLRAAGYEAQTCSHTMDVLREAANGHFDLVALGLDLPGFVRANAVEAFREVAPDVALIAFHNHPAEVMQAMARAGVAAVLGISARTLYRKLREYETAFNPLAKAATDFHENR